VNAVAGSAISGRYLTFLGVAPTIESMELAAVRDCDGARSPPVPPFHFNQTLTTQNGFYSYSEIAPHAAVRCDHVTSEAT
jgi:hypothetical protein